MDLIFNLFARFGIRVGEIQEIITVRIMKSVHLIGQFLILYLPINKLTPKYKLIPKVTSYSFIHINSKSYDGKPIL